MKTLRIPSSPTTQFGYAVILTLLINLLISPVTFANPEQHNKQLIMATSEGPPYMIRKPVSGLDIDTVKAALEQQGYQVDVQFYSLHRAMAELVAKRVDLVVPSFVTEQPGLFNGDPHILYRPTVFSLKSKNIQLNSIADMGNYRIASFQGVIGYFGAELEAATQRAPAFYQHRSMEHLIDMLMNDRADLVLLDYWIFDYFYRQSLYTIPYDANDQLFPRVPAVPVFRDPDIRDAYNRGLQQIHDNGAYRQMMDKFGHD